ncbi:MAG: 3,4-dihydroxy 2-butanone 4-phosphate synthase / GTP cyclohydrolase II [bacterium]|nr:MAG: 3,4-dihydroxy 2-butanone 4-phosphate synthase / GTP cyclohydrolase II [bacterium]
MQFCSVEEAIAEIRAGGMLVVVDSEDRENEGDLVMAAEFITPEAINFMETHARGWVCVPLEGHLLDALELPMMVDSNTARLGTAFTVTVDACWMNAPDRRTCCGPATSARSGPPGAECSSGRATPRRRWTWPASRA